MPAALAPRVSDLMRPTPLTVGAGVLASAVAVAIETGLHRHVLVTDADGVLVGLVNRARLLRHLVARRLTRDATPDEPIGALVVWPLVTTTPETPVADALCLMRRHRVGSLPVLDADGRLAGLLSERMLLGYAEAVLADVTADPA